MFLYSSFKHARSFAKVLFVASITMNVVHSTRIEFRNVLLCRIQQLVVKIVRNSALFTLIPQGLNEFALEGSGWVGCQFLICAGVF